MDTEPFLGEIGIFSGNFPPRGWAFCDGQLLPINQNQALFALLGTTYGGNGRTTFALPDLRGRMPIHGGQGNGLSNRTLGEAGGAETHTLRTEEMPAHAHAAGAASGAGTSASPKGNVWAGSVRRDNQYAGGGDAVMKPDAVAASGGGRPHENMPPYLALSYVIALQGVFPSSG